MAGIGIMPGTAMGGTDIGTGTGTGIGPAAAGGTPGGITGGGGATIGGCDAIGATAMCGGGTYATAAAESCCDERAGRCVALGTAAVCACA